MHRQPGVTEPFKLTINLKPGATYQYKFIVDNEWKYDGNKQTVTDPIGNVNNCILIETV